MNALELPWLFAPEPFPGEEPVFKIGLDPCPFTGVP